MEALHLIKGTERRTKTPPETPLPLTFLIFLRIDVLGTAHVAHDVHGIRNIEVKIRRSLIGVRGRAIGYIHLGPEVRPHEAFRKPSSEIETPVPPRVLTHREAFHEVFEAGRKHFGEVVRRRPVLQFEHHRLTFLILQALSVVLEPVPELLHRLVGDDVFGEAIYQVIFNFPKISGERLRFPQVGVEGLAGPRDDDGLAPLPLVLEYGNIVLVLRVVQVK